MSEKRIKIQGIASKKEWELIVKLHHQSLSLLDFLTLNKFPIASSCRGEGTCKKCVYDDEKLSCQVTMDELFKETDTVTVSFSYL